MYINKYALKPDMCFIFLFDRTFSVFPCQIFLGMNAFMKSGCYIQNLLPGRNIRRAAVIAVLICASLCMSSCSKKRVPDFYGAKDDVLHDLLAAFEEKDYNMVLTKIDRYRTHSGVDKDMLSELERAVNENIAVEKANKALAAGDFNSAVSELEPFVEVDPLMKESVQKLRVYIQGREKLDNIKRMTYSEDIIMAAMDFSAFIKARPEMFPKTFQAYCDKCIADAEILSKKEQRIAQDLLFRDASHAIENNQPSQAAVIYTYFSLQDSSDAGAKVDNLTNQGLFDR